MDVLNSLVLGIISNILASSWLWERVRKFLKNISIPPNALLWKIDHKELVVREEISDFKEPLEVTLGTKHLSNLSFSSVRFWHSSKIPIEQYPIIIRFGSGTTILQWVCRIVPDKDVCHVIQDEKSQQMAERAYFISLKPKDVLTLKFQATGEHDVKSPIVLARKALLTEENKAIILLDEDAVQISTAAIRTRLIGVSGRLSGATQVALIAARERFIVVSKRLSDATQVALTTIRKRLIGVSGRLPGATQVALATIRKRSVIIWTNSPRGGGISTILLLIFLIVFSTILIQTNWLGELGGPIDLGYLLLGFALAATIGLIFFRLRVWGDNIRTLFQVLFLNFPGVSTSPVRRAAFWDALSSGVSMVGVGLTMVVTTLEFYDRHDLVMQVIDFIFIKMGKLVNALTH